MKKVIVIGSPGSGKSTFARALRDVTGLPLFHLDMLGWNADKTTVPREIFDERLAAVLARDEWIIDGNYTRTIEPRLCACDTVFLLDYPVEVCLAGVAARRGKPRADMPWVEEDVDEEFLDFIRTFPTERLPRIKALLAAHPELSVVIFTSRGQSEEYLRRLAE